LVVQQRDVVALAGDPCGPERTVTRQSLRCRVQEETSWTTGSDVALGRDHVVDARFRRGHSENAKALEAPHVAVLLALPGMKISKQFSAEARLADDPLGIDV